MRRLAILLGVLLAALCPPAGASCPDAHAGVPSVYLVQNSGWMEPFYTDPQSSFRPLVEALIGATAGDGDAVVADFNQNGQIPGRSSPTVRLCGRAEAARVAAAVESITLPRLPGGRLADADIDGALVRSINLILDGQSGIVWIVTNNKDSPNNSQEVSANTRAFAARLSGTAALSRIVAYPIRMPVQGRLYAERGLIIYGIAYGPQADARLGELVRGDALRQLFPDPAVRLKPLTEAPLVFTPLATPQAGVSVGVAPDGTLVFDGVPGGRASVLEVEGSLTSEYYPQVIDQAQVNVAWRSLQSGAVPGAVPGAVVGSVEPAELHRLAPRDVLQNVHLRVAVPAVMRQPGLAGLMQRDVTIAGTLAIGLSDLRLTMPDSFRDKMAQIAALDQLPAVFFDYRSVSSAETLVPVRLVIRFSAWPLGEALGTAALALAALAGSIVALRREREQLADLGGQTRRVRLRAFQTRPMTAPDGRRFTVRGTLWGAARVAEIDPAHKT